MLATLALAVSCWFVMALTLCLVIGRAAARRDRMHELLEGRRGQERRESYDLAR